MDLIRRHQQRDSQYYQIVPDKVCFGICRIMSPELHVEYEWGKMRNS